VIAVMSFVTTAQATSTYLGTGPGKQCYDAVTLRYATSAAIKTCSAAIESGTLIGNNLPATYVNRGILYMRLEKYKAAIADYKFALRHNPQLAEAKVNMGAALIGMRRYDSAIAVLKEGLAEDPISPHVAYYNLGIAYEMLGDDNAAWSFYNSAAQIAPQWSPALRKLADIPPPEDVGELSSKTQTGS